MKFRMKRFKFDRVFSNIGTKELNFMEFIEIFKKRIKFTIEIFLNQINYQHENQYDFHRIGQSCLREKGTPAKLYDTLSCFPNQDEGGTDR